MKKKQMGPAQLVYVKKERKREREGGELEMQSVGGPARHNNEFQISYSLQE